MRALLHHHLHLANAVRVRETVRMRLLSDRLLSLAPINRPLAALMVKAGSCITKCRAGWVKGQGLQSATERGVLPSHRLTRNTGHVYWALHCRGSSPTSSVLQVGDVLYLPRGTVHQAVAQTEDSSHLTLSSYQRWTLGAGSGRRPKLRTI